MRKHNIQNKSKVKLAPSCFSFTILSLEISWFCSCFNFLSSALFWIKARKKKKYNNCLNSSPQYWRHLNVLWDLNSDKHLYFCLKSSRYCWLFVRNRIPQCIANSILKPAASGALLKLIFIMRWKDLDSDYS